MNLFEKIEQPIMVIGEKLNNNKALKILRISYDYFWFNYVNHC